jgi:hypothetical protein
MFALGPQSVIHWRVAESPALTYLEGQLMKLKCDPQNPTKPSALAWSAKTYADYSNGSGSSKPGLTGE